MIWSQRKHSGETAARTVPDEDGSDQTLAEGTVKRFSMTSSRLLDSTFHKQMVALTLRKHQTRSKRKRREPEGEISRNNACCSLLE